MCYIIDSLQAIPNQIGTCILEISSGRVMKTSGRIDINAASLLHQIIKSASATVNDEPIKKITIKQSGTEYSIVFDESLAYAIAKSS